MSYLQVLWHLGRVIKRAHSLWMNLNFLQLGI